MSESWIVLGSAGISYGPMTKPEAEAFAKRVRGRIALPLSRARSQIETCVEYGLDYKPLSSDLGTNPSP